MKKILLLEEVADKKPEGYDKVFSCIENPADAFSSDFLGPREASEIYDRVFTEIMPFLEDVVKGEEFRYRGVDLVWCFKKPLFETAYFSALRLEAFRRLEKAHPEAEFYIQSDPRGLPHGVGLHDILEPSSRIKALPAHEEAQKPASAVAPTWRRFFRPFSADRSLDSRTVAVFSDYAKCRELIHSLGEKGVFFTDSYSPKLRLAFLREEFGYHAIPSGETTALAAGRAAAFSAKAATKPLFPNFPVLGPRGGALLDKRLRDAFSSSLAPLLASTDELHAFFSRAASLESALLDEDIAPVKNAFCQMARQYDVTTYVECHGALGHASGFLPLTADFILAWGEAQKEKLVRWSCPPDRIQVTGCSRYTPYEKLDAAALKKKIAPEFGFDASKKIALVAFPPFKRAYRLLGHAELKVIEDTLAVIEKFPDNQFLLKIHAGDENSARLFQRYKDARFAGRITVVEKYDPMILARAVDFMIVNNSTYALDGFAMGKPVLSVFDAPCRILEETREFEVFTYADDPAAIERAVRHLFETSDGRRGRWGDARERCLNARGPKPLEAILGLLLSKQTVEVS